MGAARAVEEHGDDQLKALKEAGMTIAASSGDHVNKLFPEGSDHAPTRALPSVWQKCVSRRSRPPFSQTRMCHRISLA